MPGWLSHPTEVPDRARFPTNLARNLTRSLLSTTRKRWNCNDAISISEIVREELRATLLGNHVRSYTSQGPTRRRVLHTTGPTHNRSIGSALQYGPPHGRPYARAWACGGTLANRRASLAPSPRSAESAMEPGRVSSGRTRSSHEGGRPSSMRWRSTSETKRATRRRLRGAGASLTGGFPDRPTQPPPRHEQRPQALCDAQRCRAPRQTGNRVA